MGRRFPLVLGMWMVLPPFCGTLGAQPPPAMRLKPVVVRDDFLKMDALRALAPADWKVRGAVHWRMHPLLPATVSLEVRDAQGVEGAFFYPNLPFAAGVREMLLRRAALAGPQAQEMIRREFADGARYFGNEIRPAATEPEEYLTRYLLPRLRPDIAEYRILGKQNLPEWARSSVTAALVGKEFPVRARAGRVRLEYRANGRLVHEEFYLLLAETDVGEVTYWSAESASSARAEPGNLGQVVRLHDAMQHSCRIELPWFDQVAQAAELIRDGIRRHQRMIGDFSDYLRRTSAEITRSNREAYEARMRSQDRVAEKFSEYLRGVESYIDPQRSTPVELPAGYDHVWATPLGEYVLTNDGFYDPNLTLHGTWSRLRRKD